MELGVLHTNQAILGNTILKENEEKDFSNRTKYLC